MNEQELLQREQEIKRKERDIKIMEKRLQRIFEEMFPGLTFKL